jgi:hypothetical protein
MPFVIAVPTIIEHASRQTSRQADADQYKEHRNLEFPKQRHLASFQGASETGRRFFSGTQRAAIVSERR